MASLNTLRTKFGVVLSVVIAGALLAFIFSLRTEMGFTSNDPVVGKMDGNKVTYTEYLAEYETAKQNTGLTESDDQQVEQLANATWQNLFSKKVLVPAFEQMGLSVSEAERLAIMSGDVQTQAFYSYFADPQTGVYNINAVNTFLAQAAANPEAEQMWQSLVEGALREREAMKFSALLRAGAYVNKLQVANGVEQANKSFSGKWYAKRYTAAADSLFTVSDGEVRSFYEQHKNQYKQQPSRTMQYVEFPVSATADDKLAIESKVREMASQMRAAEDARQYARENSRGSIANNYVTAAQLDEAEAEVIMDGGFYGPVLENDVWTAAKGVDFKVASDTLGVRHIILPYSEGELADSLIQTLKAGADFAETARQYSVYEQTAQNGGEVGKMPFSSFTNEFIEPMSTAAKGDILKIENGEYLQIIQVYYAGPRTKHVQLASIEYQIEPSAATRNAVHAEASNFLLAAKGSAAQFEQAASDAGVTPRTASLTPADRSIRTIEDSREISRWAHEADLEDVSEIFTQDNSYIVAQVTEESDAKYRPIESVATQIRSQLLRDKKFEQFAAEVKGTTLAEQAEALGVEVEEFKDVNFGSFYIQGLGVEPKVVGAIAATTAEGAVSAPVQGNTGMYVFQVDEIAVSEEQTAEAQRVRAQTAEESRVDQSSYGAIQQLAEIEDLRGRYL